MAETEKLVKPNTTKLKKKKSNAEKGELRRSIRIAKYERRLEEEDCCQNRTCGSCPVPVRSVQYTTLPYDLKGTKVK